MRACKVQGMAETTALSELPLAHLHAELGAKFCPFAGTRMPLHYTAGVLHEHLHTRAEAGLFDVSHMGQITLHPHGQIEELALALERLIPTDLAGVPIGKQLYSGFPTETGGLHDDLIIGRAPDHFRIVVNAGGKAKGMAHLQAHLGGVADIALLPRVLLAVQGPAAEAVIAHHIPAAVTLRFMEQAAFQTAYGDIWIARGGYTGEDGFELSLDPAEADAFARALLQDPRLQPAGLGARDSLRLEAGLCLYGQDLGEDIPMIAAGLGWTIPALRRAGGARAGGFIGADVILRDLATPPARRRMGLLPDGAAPMRAGTEVTDGTTPLGHVTSGGYSPTLGRPIAMALLDRAAQDGRPLFGIVRGKALPLSLTQLPFVPAHTKR